jgi:type I pantothenate kinase
VREAGRYTVFDRAEWAKLRLSTPLTLSDADLTTLRGLNDRLSLAEVEDVFLPITRLLNLHIGAARALGRVRDAFLGRVAGSPPYIVGIAGSVAVGKSTFARVLKELLGHWPDHPKVALVTTDGFLHPNEVLIERDLMRRKGFPESYDTRAMIRFLAAVKAGEPEVTAPVYSHRAYDILPGQRETVRRPDVLVFEGLNVLQAAGAGPGRPGAVAASDFLDFSIYIDAREEDIEKWYIERFRLLQRTAFQHPHSYFHHYRDLPPDAAATTARGIWRDINLVNLRDNIQPTRERAQLILGKRADHAIEEVRLRRL